MIKLETVKKENETMYFMGKERSFDYVVYTINPFDGKLAISVSEYRRLKEIVDRETKDKKVIDFAKEEIDW